MIRRGSWGPWSDLLPLSSIAHRSSVAGDLPECVPPNACSLPVLSGPRPSPGASSSGGHCPPDRDPAGPHRQSYRRSYRLSATLCRPKISGAFGTMNWLQASVLVATGCAPKPLTQQKRGRQDGRTSTQAPSGVQEVQGEEGAAFRGLVSHPHCRIPFNRPRSRRRLTPSDRTKPQGLCFLQPRKTCEASSALPRCTSDSPLGYWFLSS